MIKRLYFCTARRFVLFVSLIAASVVSLQAQEQLPRENVVETPAISEGLCVSNLFQSNMVLQRDKPIVIWGWAAQGETVAVSFGGQTAKATAGTDRDWKVTLPKMKANAKPMTLTVKGAEKTLTLTDILIGDVWVLGGQSNMEFPISRVENGALEIASANYPNIRILTIPYQNGDEEKKGFERLQEWSGWFKQHYRKGYWDPCTPKNIFELSAIGLVFARRLHTGSKVPIGVIDVSRGGTTVEAWTPDANLRKIDSAVVKAKLAKWDKDVADWDAKKDLEERIKRHREWVERMKKAGKAIPANRKEPTDVRPGPDVNQNRPGNCYASMMAPLVGLNVKGAIFHQGYNNCFEGTTGAKMYRAIFPHMIKAWRGAFNDPQLPFGILSLCTSGHPQTRDNYSEYMFDAGAYIREAQYQTFLELYKAGDKNIGFVSTFDFRRRWYHPQLKVPAGERAARWAMATQYGAKDVLWRPPFITGMKVVEGTIEVSLDATVGSPYDGAVEGFAIAGKDRKFHPAKAARKVLGKDPRGRSRTDGKTLVLTSPMVPEPVHYRYAWARNPMGNVVITQGRQPPFTDVPLATQRSDDWPLEDIPLRVLGLDQVPTALTRAQRYGIIGTLRLQDMQRRLKEAELLIKELQPKYDEALKKQKK